MSWLRLDDGFCDHPKIALLPVKSRWAHLHGLCYCNRFLTDGVIPIEVANRWEGVTAVAVLVERGIWEMLGRDYNIVGYLEWNPSKAEVEKRRQQDLDRKNRYRSRVDDEAVSRVPRDADGRVTGDAVSRVTGEWSGVERSGEVRKRQEEPPDFVEFYERAYPRREGRGEARKAWPKAIAKERAEVIIAAAYRFQRDPNREEGYTPHPATWLNQERWSDEPLPVRSAGRAPSVGNILRLADQAEGVSHDDG